VSHYHQVLLHALAACYDFDIQDLVEESILVFIFVALILEAPEAVYLSHQIDQRYGGYLCELITQHAKVKDGYLVVAV
jgi:hypothetical protein